MLPSRNVVRPLKWQSSGVDGGWHRSDDSRKSLLLAYERANENPRPRHDSANVLRCGQVINRCCLVIGQTHPRSLTSRAGDAQMILITGASGNVGQEVLKQIAELGRPVRAAF